MKKFALFISLVILVSTIQTILEFDSPATMHFIYRGTVGYIITMKIMNIILRKWELK